MSISDELSQGVANGATCICGKNSKDANRISCVAFRCPCCKHHPPCTRRRPCHTPFARKIEVKDQLLVEGVDVGAHANRKLTHLVRWCAETESESQSVHALQEVLAARRCVCASTVGTLFVHVLSQLHQCHWERGSENLFLHIKRKRGQQFMKSEKAPVDLGPWRVLGMLCLIVCRDVLVINTIATTSTNLKVLSHLAAKNFILHQMVPSLKAFPLMVTSKASSSGRAKWGLMFLLYISINL